MRVDLSELLPIRRGDNLILDTDMSSDCDDAGALSLLIDGCRKTGAALKAVINDTDNFYANGAIDAILSYYGAEEQIGQTSDKRFETEKIPINIKYNRYLSEPFSLNVLEDGSLRLCYDNGALCRFASFSDQDAISRIQNRMNEILRRK